MKGKGKIFVLIFIMQITLAYLFTLYYDNNFFVISIMLSLIIEFIIIIVIFIVLNSMNNKYVSKLNNIYDTVYDPVKRLYNKSILVKKNSKKWRLILALYCFTTVFPLATVYFEQHTTKSISSPRDFYKIHNNLDGKYYLTNDIDLTNYSYKTNNKCDINNKFIGSLDGKGYSINNLHQELFYCVGKTGQISNLRFINVDINSNTDRVGTVTKVNYGRLFNIEVEGNVKGNDTVGGLVGENSGIIELSSFAGLVEGQDYIGGISGENRGNITKLYAVGTVNGNNYVGGIVGYNVCLRCFISNAYSNSTIIGNNLVGGIVGRGIIRNSFVLGDVYVNQNEFLPSDRYSPFDFTLGNIYSYGNYDLSKGFIYSGKTIENYDIPTSSIITEKELLDKNWYINTLNYDENIWDFSVLENGCLPILKNKEGQTLYKISDNN
ncbi:hypothetical protein KHQ81_09335 [Mycoplasmatota bacterium]|nr:hypothetical protein KHQ81_09335 [Mycoplasmatota bacterium]